MTKRIHRVALLSVLFSFSSGAEESLKETILAHSEAAVLTESTAVEQAEARAKSRSEYGLELRPGITDNDVGLALRIYLPDRWNQNKLREQLALVAESEQLRVASLEWQELMQVYRLFSEYRMVQKQLSLFDAELEGLEPYLNQANLSVELNQLAVVDRAKLYSLYLDLVNSRERVKSALLDSEQELRFMLGVNANLERLAQNSNVKMPSQLAFDELMRQALNNRPDYRQFDVQARSFTAAEGVAQSEDGFRLKYIQPAYAMNYNNGESSVGLSASFILPWGTRNPDVAVYQEQRTLAYAAQKIQRSVIEEHLQVLLKTTEAYYAQAAERSAKLKPLLVQLNDDLEQMNTGRLEELRDRMLIRERILDVSLQTTRFIRKKENMAIDLVEELGALSP